MCHVCYYNNSDATFRLLKSGKINPNPGPVSASTAGTINCLVMNARSLKSYHKAAQQTGNPCVTSFASRTLCRPKTLTLFASMRHGWTKISATLKYCFLALQYLEEIYLIEVVMEFLSQSKQPPSNLSKNFNLNRKPSCNSLRSFLPTLLRLLVKEFYSVFDIGHPVKTQVGWMYSIIFCIEFVTSSTIW